MWVFLCPECECQQLAAKTYVSLVPFAGTAGISESTNLVLKIAD